MIPGPGAPSARGSSMLPTERAPRPLLLHAFVALGCDVAYLVVIHGEGNLSLGDPVVLFVATYVAGLFAASISAVVTARSAARTALLWWAIAGSVATGLLGAFSLVMLPLIPAAVPLVPVAIRTRARARRGSTPPSSPWPSVVAPSVLAIAVLVGGLLAAHAISP